MAPRPPFATDEPDSFYESAPAPQRRIRQPAPPNPNDRTSAYNVYENYLGTDDAHAGPVSNRQSGVGALGMGLMNMSDSDDSDDEGPARRPSPSQSKSAALAAATAPRSFSKQVVNPDPEQVQAPIIVAPRPGYAAPIAALNLARPDNATTRASPPPPPQPIGVPSLENPFEPPMARVYNPRGGLSPSSPSPSGPPSAPHPLQPPITPITPVFARPGGVSFSDPIPRSKPIMRSGTEDALPTRRGEKGDDFWRRFSMVAKIENASGTKESRWLKKTQNGSSRLSRWVWVVAIVLILCIIAACIIGWRVSRNKPNSAPTALGGQANERPTSSSAVPDVVGSSTVKHVSPTYTVARREDVEPIATGIPHGHRRALERRKRLFDAVIAH